MSLLRYKNWLAQFALRLRRDVFSTRQTFERRRLVRSNFLTRPVHRHLPRRTNQFFFNDLHFCRKLAREMPAESCFLV